MYKFFSLRNARTSHLALRALFVAVSLSMATTAVAETKAAGSKADSAKATVSTQPSANAGTPAEKPAATAATATSARSNASGGTETSGAESGGSESANSTGAETAETPQRKEPTAEEREQARLAFEAASKAFSEENYEVALAEFRRAYEIIPSPHAEYWIALSMDKADPETKDPKALAVAYRTFLTNPGASHVGAEEVEAAKARLAELRKNLPATVTIVSTPAGAAVTINGEPKEGVTPLTLELPPGTYQVGLSLDGYDTANVEVNAEGGVALEQQVQLAQSVVAPPPAEPAVKTQAEPAPQQKSMVPAYVTLGLGAAGLVSGTIFGIMALNSKSKFKDDPTTDHADAAERNALIADMSFGIALTLGLTGIVLLTSHDAAAEPSSAQKKQGKKTEFAWAPYASPRGAGAAARLTF